jgi:uncharacterized protein YjiS (DUF1127 family)
MNALAQNKTLFAPFASGWLQALQSRVQQYRAYRNTLNELMCLSDRELSDLGLHRSMLRRVAYQAAYETR